MSEAAPTLPAGFILRRYDKVGSTNDEAKALARAGAPELTLVWAGEQTAGRGRRGRVWQSPPGNLYLSLVLRPDGAPAHAAQLGFVAALALTDALVPLAGPGVRLSCKWPNDVLANRKKLAGILLESETSAPERLDFVVLGIGVNIAAAPHGVEYPATSLADEGITGVTPAMLLAAFGGHFVAWRRRWLSAGFRPVREAWLRRAEGIGEAIRVRLERGTLVGRFADLDEDGGLLLDAADGRRRITAGEVFPAAAAEAPPVFRDGASRLRGMT